MLAFNGTELLLCVIQILLSTASTTISHPRFPFSFLLPSQYSRIAFHVSVFFGLHDDFRNPFCSQVRHMVGLQVMLSADLHPPILPLYFLTKTWYPFVHLQATLLSPHMCTVVPSPPVQIVLSGGRRLPSGLFFFPCQLSRAPRLLGLCTTRWPTFVPFCSCICSSSLSSSRSIPIQTLICPRHLHDGAAATLPIWCALFGSTNRLLLQLKTFRQVPISAHRPSQCPS